MRATWLTLLIAVGLRYTGRAAVPGAQTERPGRGRAGEGFAWRQDLTGRFVQTHNDSRLVAPPADGAGGAGPNHWA